MAFWDDKVMREFFIIPYSLLISHVHRVRIRPVVSIDYRLLGVDLRNQFVGSDKHFLRSDIVVKLLDVGKCTFLDSHFHSI